MHGLKCTIKTSDLVPSGGKRLGGGNKRVGSRASQSWLGGKGKTDIEKTWRDLT